MPTGPEIAIDLLRASRALVEELHMRLSDRGHPELRPAHGYAFQAIGDGGTNASRLGELLGVTKQAAGQMVDELESLGYVARGPDPADARRRLVRLTPRGEEALRLSAETFESLREEWVTRVGAGALAEMDASLKAAAEMFGSGDRALRPVW